MISDQNESTSYEEQRRKNIERNQRLLASLGLMSIRQELSQQPLSKKRVLQKPKAKKELDLTPHHRRQSSRLKGVKAPDYKESNLNIFGKTCSSQSRSLQAKQPFQPHEDEFYTVSNIDALRDCATSYEKHHMRLQLETRAGKVGRYRKDTGSERAKSVGKTCHWCRQKDTSKKTSCAQCGLSQGVLCGPCLQGRYGENLFEIVGPDAVDPNWTCPACRDICNCSAASCLRQKRGWGATGALVSKAYSNGYQSVAHYLVLGKGFDSVIVALETAIQDKNADDLEYLLQKTSKMELEKEPRDRTFVRMLSTNKGEAGEQEASEDVLFCWGASTAAVVSRLRALCEEAKAVAHQLGIVGTIQVEEDTATKSPYLSVAESISSSDEEETKKKENVGPPQCRRAKKRRTKMSPMFKEKPKQKRRTSGRKGMQEENHPKICLGTTKLRKSFGSQGSFVGTIMSKNEEYFLVEYEDGDKEELTEAEIFPLIQNQKKKIHRMSPEQIGLKKLL